ncbi:MAG TPA: HisA/HisF-related TIM barrel protein [Pirellulaceae bacterium]|nr:HisA/HisF-related TIM barrel protein [Pirellulaceae bacterium]
MQIIPVIDLLGGQVVRGIGGRRSEYRPIESQLVRGSDPGAIAAAFVEHFGATTCYVADLDAIERDCWQIEAWKAISRTGMRLWLDAGLGEPELLGQAWGTCRNRRIDAECIVGLESLAMNGWSLSQIVPLIRLPLIFSLDMKDGRPLTKHPSWQSLDPPEIASRVLETGITRMIVLDLADVGTSGGTRTLDLCRELKAEYPQLELIAGGGVRSIDDLKRIADAGCTAALVASALHDGRLTRADWNAAAAL